MSQSRVIVLITYPKAAQFKEFRRRWRDAHFPLLLPDEVTIAFAWIKSPDDLQDQIARYHPDILVVHGSLLGDQPAYAAAWVLTQGTASVLITDDGDASRHFETKRCHVLPVGGGSQAIAEALGVEVKRVQLERSRRAG